MTSGGELVESGAAEPSGGAKAASGATNVLTSATNTFAQAIDERGVYAFTMGFGAALITFACLMKIGYGDYELTQLTTSEFTVMILGGIALLIAGAVYRYLQLQAANGQIDRAVGLLEQAAEQRRIAADKATDIQNESARAQAKNLERAADMREKYANQMLDVKPQPESSSQGRPVVAASDAVEQIAKAKQLLDSGAISAAEFEQLKQRALA